MQLGDTSAILYGPLPFTDIPNATGDIGSATVWTGQMFSDAAGSLTIPYPIAAPAGVAVAGMPQSIMGIPVTPKNLLIAALALYLILR